MKLRVLPYITVEVDDGLRRRLRSSGERFRINIRAYLRSAADDVGTASDRVRLMCDNAVERVDSAVASVNNRIAPESQPDPEHGAEPVRRLQAV